MYDMLRTGAKSCIIMCKLVKLAFCLCCGPIDPWNIGFGSGACRVYGVGKAHLLHSYFMYVFINVSAIQQPGNSPIY